MSAISIFHEPSYDDATGNELPWNSSGNNIKIYVSYAGFISSFIVKLYLGTDTESTQLGSSVTAYTIANNPTAIMNLSEFGYTFTQNEIYTILATGNSESNTYTIKYGVGQYTPPPPPEPLANINVTQLQLTNEGKLRVQWDQINEATKYRIIVLKGTEQVDTQEITDNTITSYSYPAYGAAGIGEYTIKAQASNSTETSAEIPSMISITFDNVPSQFTIVTTPSFLCSPYPYSVPGISYSYVEKVTGRSDATAGTNYVVGKAGTYTFAGTATNPINSANKAITLYSINGNTATTSLSNATLSAPGISSAPATNEAFAFNIIDITITKPANLTSEDSVTYVFTAGSFSKTYSNKTEASFSDRLTTFNSTNAGQTMSLKATFNGLESTATSGKLGGTDFTARPAAPTGLALTYKANTNGYDYTLSWNAVTGITRYDVYVAGAKVAETSATSTELTNVGITGVTQNRIAVVAVYDAGLFSTEAAIQLDRPALFSAQLDGTTVSWGSRGSGINTTYMVFATAGTSTVTLVEGLASSIGTYTLTAANIQALDYDTAYNFIVRETNIGGYFQEATTEATFNRGPANQPPIGSVTISGTATEGQQLTASASITDADGPEQITEFSYVWKRNGEAISGATAITYTLVRADVDRQITVTVSYTDAKGTLESVTSAATGLVAVLNTPAQGELILTFEDGKPLVGKKVFVDASAITDADGMANVTGFFYDFYYGSGNSYVEYENYRAFNADTKTENFTLLNTFVGSNIKIVCSFTDDYGSVETKEVISTEVVRALPNLTGSVTATRTGADAHISVSWPTAANATSYKVEVSTNAGASYTEITLDNGKYTPSPLPTETTTYKFRVTAMNDDGEGTPIESAGVEYFVPTVSVAELPSVITYGSDIQFNITTNIDSAQFSYRNVESDTTLIAPIPYTKDYIGKTVKITAAGPPLPSGGLFMAETTVAIPAYTAPENIPAATGTALANGSARFTWDAPNVPGATLYSFNYTYDGITNTNVYDTLSITSYISSADLTDGEIAQFVIEAYDGDFLISKSPAASVTIEKIEVGAIEASINQATGVISWNAAANAISYEVLYGGQVTSAVNGLSDVSIVGTTFAIPTSRFQPGGSYVFTVRANGPDGASPKTASVTYAPAVPAAPTPTVKEENSKIVMSFASAGAGASYKVDYNDGRIVGTDTAVSINAITAIFGIDKFKRGTPYNFILTVVYPASAFIFNDGVDRESEFTSTLYTIPASPPPSINTSLVPLTINTVENNIRLIPNITQIVDNIEYNITMTRNLIQYGSTNLEGGMIKNFKALSFDVADIAPPGKYDLLITGTLGSASAAFPTRSVTRPMDAPAITAPTAVALGSNIAFSWARPSNVLPDDTIEYDLQYGSDSSWTNIGTVAGTGVTFLLISAMLGKQFKVIARMTNADGTTTFVESSATVAVPPALLAAPTDLTDTVDGKTVSASWSAVDGATSYEVTLQAAGLADVKTIVSSTTSATLTARAKTRSATLSVVAVGANGRSPAATISRSGFSIDAPSIGVTPVTEGGRGFDIIITESFDKLISEHYRIDITAGSYSITVYSNELSQYRLPMNDNGRGTLYYSYRNADLPSSDAYTVSVRVDAAGSIAASQPGIALPMAPATLVSFTALQSAATTQTINGVTVPTVSVSIDGVSAAVTAPLVTMPASSNTTELTERINDIITTTEATGGVFVTNHILAGSETAKASVGLVGDDTKDVMLKNGNTTITLKTTAPADATIISINGEIKGVIFGLPTGYKLVFSNFDTVDLDTDVLGSAFYKVAKPVGDGTYQLLNNPNFLENDPPFCIPISITIDQQIYKDTLIYRTVNEEKALSRATILQSGGNLGEIPFYIKVTTGELLKDESQSYSSKTTYIGNIISNSTYVAERCLLGHTRIHTPAGLRAVETLAAGDLVLTDDRREVPIRAVHKSTVKATKKNAPYRFEAGSIAAGYPRKAFEVSPDHAIAAPGGWLIPRYAGLAGVKAEQTHIGEEITYYHLELPNYLRDNLVLEGGTIVESDGEKWLSEQANPDATPYVINKANGLFRRAAVAHVRSKAAGGAGARG
jgi:hypothetical protein